MAGKLLVPRLSLGEYLYQSLGNRALAEWSASMSFGRPAGDTASSRVFSKDSRVSDNVTHAASIALIEQTQRENAAIAYGLKRQDTALLDRLIEQYQHRLLRYLLFLTGKREVAEDIFQETWMRVLVRGGQYNGNARFDTWLFTIARNLVIDLSRKRTTLSLDEMRDVDESERPFEVVSDSPTPLENFQRGETTGHVAEALLQLDAIYREVLVLRFHEELSLEEISTVTRAPLSTVKSRLYRGLAALRPHIDSLTRRPNAACGAGVEQ